MVLDILEFSSLVSDISDSIGGFSSMIKEIGEEKKYINKTFSIKLSDKKYFDLFIGKKNNKKAITRYRGNYSNI